MQWPRGGDLRVASSLLVVLALSVAACSPQQREADDATLSADQSAKPGKASFINKVWQVSTSNAVPPGQLYIFLSEGTLVVASPTGKPSLGSWRFEAGKLTMTEEGIHYPTDILSLTDSELLIRMHGPGEPVEITLRPAEHLPGG